VSRYRQEGLKRLEFTINVVRDGNEINNPLQVISGKVRQLERLFAEEPINREKGLEGTQKISDMVSRITKPTTSLFG